MNAVIRVSLLVLFAFSIQWSSLAQSSDSLKMDSANQSRFVNGLAANDESVFEEVSRLPVAQGAPLLLVYVNDASTNRERAERARDRLRKMPGFSSYMKQRILKKRSRPGGEYEMDEFRKLRSVGGDESAAAAAPFLFVDDPTLLFADDFAEGPINSMALEALVDMHVPDAPKDKSYPGYTAPDIKEWKAWAEKKGYRDPTIPPLMTLQQKGVPPDAIARSAAILAGAKVSPSITPTPPASVQTQAPAPSTPLSAPLQNAKPATPPPVAQTLGSINQRRAPIWPWLVGIAALIVIVALVFKRRA